jgi:hypothetical protein
MTTKEIEALEAEIAQTVRAMDDLGLELPPGLQELLERIVSPSTRDERGAEQPRE